MRRPANQIRRKGGQMLLQIECRLGTHLQMVHGKNLLAFLDTRFDGLPTKDESCSALLADIVPRKASR
jgi:hypothetical protein